jgi:energy-coupling factor transporter ATP-binding protein EcfA2
VTEYALSTNLYTYGQAGQGFFSWPLGSGEAEVVRQLQPGDFIIPKFAASPAWAGDSEQDLDWQRKYFEAIEVDYDEAKAAYDAEVAGGENGVPFLLRVLGDEEDDTRPDGTPWARVRVEREGLAHPLSSKELLLLRGLPIGIAAQFKGQVSPGRHLQEVPNGTVQAVRDAASSADRSEYLRRYSVVEATTAEAAQERLTEAGRPPRPGDRAFIATPAGLLGVHDAHTDGTLHAVGEPIPKTPEELMELFQEAKAKARKEDRFASNRAIAAANELKQLLEGPNAVIAVDDFARFHDRYNLLASKVTQALAIAQRPAAPAGSNDPPPETEDDEAEEAEVDELAALQGLTVAAVRQELPEDMELPDSVLAEAVTALRAGKHLLLGGPPGTGKSTLAEALCRAVMAQQYDVVTATADWTTFDTIGGYMPKPGGTLEFEPGVILRCLQRGRWLTIDELNRADIDKAFGPLFTMLAGTGVDQPNRRTVLPFQSAAGKNIEIRWAEKRTGTSSEYVLTPGWRLIGTLNLSDKATLFQLSFAFLRRFAVVDVPLPAPDKYRTFFEGLCAEVSDDQRDNIVDAAIELAFGPRQLGPAILRDIAGFLLEGLAETASGAPTYDDEVTAFVTAVRLFAVPQYEGATAAEVKKFLEVVPAKWPERPEDDWLPLSAALAAVALT